MSLADIILERFKDFMREQPEPYKFLQVFYAQEKERFLNDKMNDYIKQNKSKEEASILARQGFVSAIGRVLEKIIELLLKDFCIKNNVKMTNDKVLRDKRINGELDRVKRALLVHFGEYSVLPDGDIVLYQTNKDSQNPSDLVGKKFVQRAFHRNALLEIKTLTIAHNFSH
ncbi:hypothetical protein VN0526_02700 [Helicobacter pylori]